MEKQKTAVDFLFEQLECLVRERNQRLIDAETFYKQKKFVLGQAKELEKKQIIDSYLEVCCNYSGTETALICDIEEAEQYYNDKYLND